VGNSKLLDKFAALNGRGAGRLASESISLHWISHCFAFAFQFAFTQAVGSNIDCSMSSASAGHVGRFVSDVCDNTASIPSRSRPDKRTADCFAFIRGRITYFKSVGRKKASSSDRRGFSFSDASGPAGWLNICLKQNNNVRQLYEAKIASTVEAKDVSPRLYGSGRDNLLKKLRRIVTFSFYLFGTVGQSVQDPSARSSRIHT
jgi:hypothetical protein